MLFQLHERAAAAAAAAVGALCQDDVGYHVGEFETLELGLSRCVSDQAEAGAVDLGEYKATPWVTAWDLSGLEPTLDLLLDAIDRPPVGHVVQVQGLLQIV